MCFFSGSYRCLLILLLMLMLMLMLLPVFADAVEPVMAMQTCSEGGELAGPVFAVASAELDQASTAVLSKAATLLLSHLPRAKISLLGHTDSDGPAAFNTRLSLQRAQTVKAFLVASGITASRVTLAGYGEERPVASNQSADGKAQNRRVEISYEEVLRCDGGQQRQGFELIRVGQ